MCKRLRWSLAVLAGLGQTTYSVASRIDSTGGHGPIPHAERLAANGRKLEWCVNARAQAQIGFCRTQRACVGARWGEGVPAASKKYPALQVITMGSEASAFAVTEASVKRQHWERTHANARTHTHANAQTTTLPDTKTHAHAHTYMHMHTCVHKQCLTHLE